MSVVRIDLRVNFNYDEDPVGVVIIDEEFLDKYMGVEWGIATSFKKTPRGKEIMGLSIVPKVVE